jgi:signal transduction histidine kinase
MNGGLSLESIFIIGTAGMIILAMGVVFFLIIYQRRLVEKENQLALQELAHQRSLMDAVIRTREMEQRRIALELHDDVGSTLTAIKFSIPLLDVPREKQDKLLDNLQSAIHKVRRISNDLLPSVLEELGLRIAAKSLMQTLGESTGVVFYEHTEGDSRPPRDIELAFYRVLQELLNNIIKYAQASFAEVYLLIDSQQVIMTVTDDGTGFTPADHIIREDNPSLGLRNMESRVQQINGSIVFKKLPEKGTSVTVTWKTTDQK